ncbi:MAG: type transporter [Chloroflexi bacterium]|nr:type transporter [Chloroflexota bacterium]
MTSMPETKPVPISRPVVIEPSRGWFNLKLKAVWRYRELLYFLAWRDVKVRYKQTALGVTWVVLQPVISMLVFSGLFGVLLQVPTGGVPYPLFVLSGLLPWQYFANSLTKSSNSLVDNTTLITKVYFPRLVVPLSAVLGGLVDFGIAAVVLGLLMVYYHTPVGPELLLLPLFLLLAMLTALGFGLWLSALNVRYRDVKQLMPFIVQVWMYLTPVVYGAALIPERFRWLLALNPMTGVVGGFRWAILGEQVQETQAFGPLFTVSVAISLLVLAGGAVYFRHTERTFADII